MLSATASQGLWQARTTARRFVPFQAGNRTYVPVRATAAVAEQTHSATVSRKDTGKIRVTLKSFEVPILEEACDVVLMAAAVSGAKSSGPVYLPTRKRLYCVLRSPHVNKDAREHFQIKTHKRLIDITEYGASTVENLLGMDLPAGVDVEVELKKGGKGQNVLLV